MSEAIVPAYLGWRNAEKDRESVRLYATDVDNSPRWANSPGGRVAETAIRERWGNAEGDRFLIVRVGNRFVSDDAIAALTEAIAAALVTLEVAP